MGKTLLALIALTWCTIATADKEKQKVDLSSQIKVFSPKEFQRFLKDPAGYMQPPITWTGGYGQVQPQPVPVGGYVSGQGPTLALVPVPNYAAPQPVPVPPVPVPYVDGVTAPPATGYVATPSPPIGYIPGIATPPPAVGYVPGVVPGTPAPAYGQPQVVVGQVGGYGPATPGPVVGYGPATPAVGYVPGAGQPSYSIDGTSWLNALPAIPICCGPCYQGIGGGGPITADLQKGQTPLPPPFTPPPGEKTTKFAGPRRRTGPRAEGRL